MRKATLFLIVAAITLWTGTVAWSMPQEKKQDANSKSSGHATEKADSTDQASDADKQSDDSSTKDATIKRKKQPRDKGNDSAVQPAGDEGIGSQASENGNSSTKKKKTQEVPPGRPANNGEELSVNPQAGGNVGIGSQASENGNSATKKSGSVPSNSATCCADMNGDGQTDKEVKKPLGGTHDRESSSPSISEGVAANPNAGSGGGGGGSSSVMTEKITIHHEGMAVEPPPATHDRESSSPSVSEGVAPNPNAGSGGKNTTSTNPHFVNNQNAGEMPGVGSTVSPPNSGSGGGGGGGTSVSTEKVTIHHEGMIVEPTGDAAGRESPSKPTLNYPPTKPSKDVQVAPGGEENPKETVEYKDGEDMTTRGVSKPPPPPPSGPGGADAQRLKNPGDYNLSTKFSVEISGKQEQGTTGTGTPTPRGGSGEGTITSRKAGKDQNSVAGPGDENPKETITSRKAGKDQNAVAGPGDENPTESVTIDAHTKRVTPSSDTSVAGGHDEENPKETVTDAASEKQKRPGRPAFGNITMQKQSAPTGEENPKETVTGTAGRVEEKHRPPLVKRSDASAKGDEAPKETVTDATGGTGTNGDTAKKKTKPQNPPQNISDGAAKGQAQEGVAPNPNAGGNGNTTGGTPATPK
jgi:hypothetical protein